MIGNRTLCHPIQSVLIILSVIIKVINKIGLQSVLHVLQYTIIKRPLSHIEKRIDDIMKTKFVKL